MCDKNVLTVVSAEVQRKQLFKIVFDDDSTVMIDRQVWSDSIYSTGSALTADELSALLSLSNEKRAKNKAYWLLSKRDYSKKEMYKKLIFEFDHSTVDYIIMDLCSLGFINDESYAMQLAKEYCLYQKMSTRRAVEKMVFKGILKEDAVYAVEECGADDLASAIAFLRKKCYNSSIEFSQKRKLLGSLFRLGFDYDIAQSAMKIIDDEENK